MIDELCGKSTLFMKEPFAKDFQIKTKNKEEIPVNFTFPEVPDTESIKLGDATGLDKCGPRKYTLT